MPKLTHAEAAYVENGSPTRHCERCNMFVPPAVEPSCTLVEDPIEWHGYCKFFEKKK